MSSHTNPSPDDAETVPDGRVVLQETRTVEINYFAEREQPAQARFRELRDAWLRPVVKVLRGRGLTADAVSALAVAMLVPFGIGLFSPLGGWAPLVVATSLALHVLLDGLDGPLARSMGTDGPAGAFTDMCLDHVGYLTVTVLLAAAGLLEGWIACAYAAAYTMAVVMIVVLNLLQQPLRVVVRTKYVFYALIGLQQLAGVNVLTEAALLFSAVHGASAAWGFHRVRRALR